MCGWPLTKSITSPIPTISSQLDETLGISAGAGPQAWRAAQWCPFQD
jgi:hypothetical protein